MIRRPEDVLISRISVLQQRILKTAPSLSDDPNKLWIETGTGDGWIHLSVVLDGTRLVNASFAIDDEVYRQFNYWIVDLHNLPSESEVVKYIINDFARSDNHANFVEVAPDES